MSCNDCRESAFGRECPILMKNKEYKKLSERCSLGSILDTNSDYNKMMKIREETICPKYKSIYIEYPLVVDKIETKELEYNFCLGHEIGSLVKIRPCEEKYEGKTYLGILLGDLPRQITPSYNNKTHILSVGTMTNPAIFIPEFKEIVFGDSSWWSIIKDESELKDITKEDIENTWYIRLLKGNKNGSSKTESIE